MTTPDVRAPARRPLWPALVAILLSLALLWWALRDVSVDAVLGHIRAAHLGPLFAAVAVATVTFPLRLVRWRLLLRAETGQPLPALPLWHAVAIGFMANNVLPFRAGELVRCYAASRLTGTRLTAAISSVVIERLFDALAVVVLLAVALLGPGLSPGLRVGGVSVAGAARFAGIVAVTGLAVAALVVAFPAAAERLVRAVSPSAALADRAVRFVEGLRHGLAALRSPALLAGVAVWSLVLWVVNGLSFYICFAAFDIEVGFLGALLLQGLLVFGISVPSTPGFIGPFEAVIVAVLALYGVEADRAFSYAITYHLTTFVPIILLGFWSLARTPIALGDLRRPSSA